jgi:threonine dehydratase
MTPLGAEELAETYAGLPPELKNTPLIRARTSGAEFSPKGQAPALWFKLETLQPTGAYKIRAAWTALSKMGVEATRRGAALSSSGNFAGAFTWAAHRLGVPAHLVFTPTVSGLKVKQAQQYPCTIHRCEDRYEARYEMLEQLKSRGILTIDHRLDRNVFLGHATIGWECADFADRFERVLIPLSTGGLAIGVAAALRARGFQGQILGVSPEGNPTLHRSWQEGHPVSTARSTTCCDALTATSVPQQAFDLLRALLDDVLLVRERTIKRAVGYLLREQGVATEPGAAVGMAAILEEQVSAGASLLILTGRNIETRRLIECLGAHEAAAG